MLKELTTTPTRDGSPRDYNYTTVESQARSITMLKERLASGWGQIALVTVHLTYEKAEKNEQSRKPWSEQTARSASYLLENIRPLVRKSDAIFLQQHTLYFALAQANLQGAMVVEERLWEALLWRIHNLDDEEICRPQEMTIGRSAYPEPQTSLEALFNDADRISKRFACYVERLAHQDARPIVDQADMLPAETKEELAILAKKFGIPYLSWLPRTIPRKVSETVNAALACELHCYPVGRERNMLTVAMLNPRDHAALDRLHHETGLHIFPVLTHPEALEVALKQLCARENERRKSRPTLATNLRTPV